MAKKVLIILALIVSLGWVLRTWDLSKSPPGFNWDEVSHGYNAYSILKTGKDEWGKLLPLFNFRAYGDYPATLNLYLTIPFIYTLGLNEYAVRLPHVLLGVLTIISSYFLAYGISKRKAVGLITAFLVAVSPWTLFTSRSVLQSNLSVFLLTSSMAFFFWREKKKSFLPISLVLLTLTLFSYHTTRIFSPLLLIYLVYNYREEFKNKLSIVLVSIFFLLLGAMFINPESRARSKWVFLINDTAVWKIINNRNESPLPYAFKRLLYNRPVYFVTEFTKNYLGYFSPQYLFIKGGTQYQFSVPNHGLEYIINLPLFYFGLAFIVYKSFKEKNKNYKTILVWLLLAPIAASITSEKFAVVRSTPIIPLVETITAIGLVNLVRKYKFVYFVYGFIVLFLTNEYLFNYFMHYSTYYSWAWQKGHKEAIEYIKDNGNKYDKVLFTKKYGEPHEFILFYLQYDPAKYQNGSNSIKFNQSDWWWVDRFDKYYFVNDWQVKDMILESGGKIDCKSSKCLLISSPGNSPSGWKTLEKIYYSDGSIAFEIYEN